MLNRTRGFVLRHLPDEVAGRVREVGALGRRIRGARAPAAPIPPAAPEVRRARRPGPPVPGVVEHFSPRLIMGWISVPKGSPPARVNLVLDKVRIASTFATPGDTMSGIDSVLRREAPPDAPPGAPAATPVHEWQHPHLPGPADDRRLSDAEIRTFSFRIRDIWAYTDKKTKISLRVRGRSLPIQGHGMYLQPKRNGRQSLDALQAKLTEGYLLSQWGRIQLSKRLDLEWQRNVTDLYDQVRAIVHEVHGYDLFVTYGTLLGAVRENGYIGHDIDFDSMFVSRLSDGAEVAQELVDVALTLIDRGLEVVGTGSALHINDHDDPTRRIDLFHSYFDDAGAFAAPFGIAGSTRVHRDDWQGVEKIEFSGTEVLAPVNREQLVEHLYGSDWRQPKPGFNWRIDRTHRAPEGLLTQAQRQAVYWANFYAHTAYTEGSAFYEFVNARPETPAQVVDIGCGDGRDACAFGLSGRVVLGLDRSTVGVEHAAGRAAELGVGDQVRFRTCDVSDAMALRDTLAEQLASVGDQPVLFYLRFFLHSIDEATQDTLLGVLDEVIRPGDLFAAEFRTDKDQEQTHVHGKHYRRFQNGPEFGVMLSHKLGFELLHEEEGTGLSPYQGEDPVLYRVVARRP